MVMRFELGFWLAVGAAAAVLAQNDLSESLKKCCEQGTNWSQQGLKCASFTGPVAGVPPQQQEACLTSVRLCCMRVNREKNCNEGIKQAKAGAGCTSSQDTDGYYQKECCEACKTGLLAESSSASCDAAAYGFDAPWDSPFSQCCQKTTTSTPTTTTPAAASTRTTPALETPSRRSFEDKCDSPEGMMCAHVCIPTEDSYRCECRRGFTLMNDGKSCKLKDISDRCKFSNPCQHICLDTGVAVECSCDEGYELDDDKRSCNDIDECALNLDDCKPTEDCVNEDGGFYCKGPSSSDRKEQVCPLGYELNYDSKLCNDIDECRLQVASCRKDQICQNTVGSYTCVDNNLGGPSSPVECPRGYYFSSASGTCTDIDECTEGQDDCNKESQICLNTKGGFTCQNKASKNFCPAGFKTNQASRSCEDIDECVENNEICSSSQMCINEPGGYRCINSTNTPRQPDRCPTGLQYVPEERLCKDIDECQTPNICDSNQVCENTIGSYRCNCQRGFQKDPHTFACIDVNECQINPTACHSSQRCDNTVGSYQCVRMTSCGTGYTLNAANDLCEDDDECQLGTHDCQVLGPNYQCKNTPGSFRCERIYQQRPPQPTRPPTADPGRPTSPTPVNPKRCLPGYVMNQFGSCDDMDECQQKPCGPNQYCVNIVGSFFCKNSLSCRPGFQMSQDGTRCEDIDECREGLHKCLDGQICINKEGFHICQCPAGHTVGESNRCEDLDECKLYQGRICPQNSDCQNTVGSYRCQCKDGFRPRPNNDMYCEDINECQERANLCHQTCINTWGGYRCACEHGFELGQDNRTCSDVDECEKFKDKYLCVGMCRNTAGSYTCECPPGYRLGGDGRTCQDIDECERGNVCSHPNDVCVNMRGSFKCNRITCPPKYILDTEYKNRCKRASDICRIDDLDCIKAPTSYSYNFVSFVSKLPIPPSGHLELFSMRGPKWNTTTTTFAMEFTNIRCPVNVRKAERGFFMMKRKGNEAAISLTQPIEGPQEIEIQLTMDIYNNRQYRATAVAKLFVFVSQHEF